MYSLAVTHIDTVLMTLALSTKMSPFQRKVVASLLMKGFNDKCKEAGTRVSGGQSIFNPWCIIGGVAVSTVSDHEFMRNRDSCAPGDVIVLTKPLGTQVAVNAYEWLLTGDNRLEKLKRGGVEKSEIERCYKVASASMARLNLGAAERLLRFGAKAATDVTGFGLKGHLEALLELQKEEVSAEIEVLPVIRNTVAIDKSVGGLFQLSKGLSAETSGGLLVMLPAEQAKPFCEEVSEQEGWPCFEIGVVTSGRKTIGLKGARIEEV